MAAVGDVTYDEAVARTVSDPWSKARAVTALVKAATAGDRERASMLAQEAEETARTITAPVHQADALTALVEAAAIARILKRPRCYRGKLRRLPAPLATRDGRQRR